MFDNLKPNFIWDFLRSILGFLDRIVYQLLIWIYELFFNVSRNEVFSDATIIKFFDRVFLILGIFMLFKLAFSLVNSIVNPDVLTDKEKGFGKIITRALTVVILLIALVPTGDKEFKESVKDIPDAEKSTYDYKIKTHGLLFGTLYTLQDKIVSQNTIGKIVLGTGGNTTNEQQETDLKKIGTDMAVTVLSAFFYPNTKCTNSTQEPVKDLDEFMLKMNENNCMVNGEKRYSYSYMPIISTIVGGVLVFIVFSFTIDVAIRSVKLSVLRLLAPIPVISYIDPKSAKDGAFASWTKSLSSTYLDLFLRLILIYFGIFLVSEVCQNIKQLLPKDASMINILTQVMLIVGIFFFIKQAPKFIKDIFGIKSSGGGSVGLSGLLGGTAALVGGGGMAGFALGATQGAAMANDAAAQGKAAPSAWSTMRDQMAKIRTGDKDAHGGIMGQFMDRQLYNTRERQLAKKGLTFDNLGEAKSNMYDQQDKMHQAQLKRDMSWEKLKQRGIYSAPDMGSDISRYMNDDGSWKSTDAEQIYAKKHPEQYEQHKLWNDFVESDKALSEAQTAAGKAESNYKNIKDARSASGVDPRLEDQYTSHGYRAVKDKGKFKPRHGSSVDSIDDINGIDRIAPEIGGSRDRSH